ncbi:PAS domain S-box protein [Burkholderiaceae bacterium UC74_6]
MPDSRLSRRLPLALALLALVAAAIFAIGEWAARREASAQTDAIRRVIEIHTLGLRGVAERFAYLPYALSQQQEIQAVLAHPQDPNLRERADRYIEQLNQRAGSDALYLIDTQGQTLVSSNWREPARSFVGQNYANRPYFADALAGRDGRFYGVGQTTGEPGLFLSTPVRAGEGGRVIGVAVAKVSLREIAAAWASVRDPILITDTHGIVFLSSVPDWLFQSRRALSASELDGVHRQLQYGPRETFPLLDWKTQAATVESDGYVLRTTLPGGRRSYLAIDQHLPEFGWTLTVTADRAPVVQARQRAWLLSSISAIALLLAALYWRLRERRFAEQRDIQRQLELRVRERTQELDQAHAFRQAMEDSLLVGMRARDLEGRIIYVNRAFCEMCGYPAEELLNRLPPYPYWHPQDLDKHWRDYETTMAGLSVVSGFESRIRHRDGHEVLTMVYTAKLIDAEGQHTGWMTSVVDITAQKQAEERQRESDDQLWHAQRLASLGEMAITLAHELNQPLMALSNFASAAKAFAAQGQQALLTESLDATMAQAQRSAEIVKRIRGFVRQHAISAEDCAIAPRVAAVLALLQGEIRARRARVEANLPPDLPAVRGDSVLLEQVILNLVLNGLQAMDEAGTPAEHRVVEIDAEQQGSRLRLRIADHGPGMSEAVAAQAFTPFFTTKSGGLGLGLNICRTIAESHRGTLSFENRAALEGGGAIFTLELECA